mgnify:CR=1 FL=1
MERQEPKQLDLPVPTRDAARAVVDATGAWDAQLDGWSEGTGAGRLFLPVSAGLRHGVIRGPIRIEPRREGSRVVFTPESEEWWLNTSAVVILTLSAAGALLTVLWPFFPPESGLLQVAPLGLVLALGGWFLVASRVTTRGVDDFLGLVEHLAVPEDEGEPEPPEPEPTSEPLRPG